MSEDSHVTLPCLKFQVQLAPDAAKETHSMFNHHVCKTCKHALTSRNVCVMQHEVQQYNIQRMRLKG